ncbi:MAG: YfiR family protein [Myxococcota bacterium]|nr:YfiR family protein [Myxococcota bacterium]
MEKLLLRSAFLYQLTHYAEWPPEVMGSEERPVAICVVGRDELADVLERALRGRRAGERAIVVRRLQTVERAPVCHVLFVGWSDAERVDRALAVLARRPTLTVGDGADFAQRGGMIRLIKDGERLRLEVNRQAVERAGLGLSSQLLALAKLVPSERPEQD